MNIEECIIAKWCCTSCLYCVRSNNTWHMISCVECTMCIIVIRISWTDIYTWTRVGPIQCDHTRFMVAWIKGDHEKCSQIQIGHVIGSDQGIAYALIGCNQALTVIAFPCLWMCYQRATSLHYLKCHQNLILHVMFLLLIHNWRKSVTQEKEELPTVIIQYGNKWYRMLPIHNVHVYTIYSQ